MAFIRRVNHRADADVIFALLWRCARFRIIAIGLNFTVRACVSIDTIARAFIARAAVKTLYIFARICRDWFDYAMPVLADLIGRAIRVILTFWGDGRYI